MIGQEIYARPISHCFQGLPVSISVQIKQDHQINKDDVASQAKVDEFFGGIRQGGWEIFKKTTTLFQ